MIHLLFGVSKTGTTSISNLLFNAHKFPIIYTYDMSNISVTDHKSGELEQKLNNISKRLKYKEFSDDIVEYTIYVSNDIKQQQNLKNILDAYDIKMIGTIRNPLDRRISQLFHTISYENVNKKKINPNCKIVQYMNMHNNNLNKEQVKYIVDTFFSDDIPYEYIEYFKTLKFYDFKQTFFIHLEDFETKKQELFTYLEIPENTILPKERDMMKREYAIDTNLKEMRTYVIDYMSNSDRIKRMIERYEDLMSSNSNLTKSIKN